MSSVVLAANAMRDDFDDIDSWVLLDPPSAQDDAVHVLRSRLIAAGTQPFRRELYDTSAFGSGDSEVASDIAIDMAARWDN